MVFADRVDAGRRLAERVAALGLPDPVVLGLPRGGVPVAAEVARTLGAPLDVFVARKIGAPGHAEYGIGALAEGGGAPVMTPAVRRLGVSSRALHRLVAAERAELERRVRRYRGERPLPQLASRAVVLVDDGLATGVTAEASLRALRERHVARLVLAAPVAAVETARRLRALADDVVTVHTPADFTAVGAWYDDFSQTSDEEVLRVLAEHRAGAGP